MHSISDGSKRKIERHYCTTQSIASFVNSPSHPAWVNHHTRWAMKVESKSSVKWCDVFACSTTAQVNEGFFLGGKLCDSQSISSRSSSSPPVGLGEKGDFHSEKFMDTCIQNKKKRFFAHPFTPLPSFSQKAPFSHILSYINEEVCSSLDSCVGGFCFACSRNSATGWSGNSARYFFRSLAASHSGVAKTVIQIGLCNIQRKGMHTKWSQHSNDGTKQKIALNFFFKKKGNIRRTYTHTYTPKKEKFSNNDFCILCVLKPLHLKTPKKEKKFQPLSSQSFCAHWLPAFLSLEKRKERKNNPLPTSPSLNTQPLPRARADSPFLLSLSP